MYFSKAKITLLSCIAIPVLAAAPAATKPEFRAAWRLDDSSVVMPMSTVMDEPFDDYHLETLPALEIKKPISTLYDHRYKLARLPQLPERKRAELAKEPIYSPWTLFLGGSVRVSATLADFLLVNDDGSECTDAQIFVRLKVSDADLASYRAVKEKYYLALPSAEAATVKSQDGAGRWVTAFKLTANQESHLKQALSRKLHDAFTKLRLTEGELHQESESLSPDDPRWPALMAADQKIMTGGGTLLYDVQAFRGTAESQPLLWVRGKLREGGFDRILGSYWVTVQADGAIALKEDRVNLGDNYYSRPDQDGKVSTEKLGLTLNVFSLNEHGSIGIFEYGYYDEGDYFMLQIFESGKYKDFINLYAEGC